MDYMKKNCQVLWNNCLEVIQDNIRDGVQRGCPHCSLKYKDAY